MYLVSRVLVGDGGVQTHGPSLGVVHGQHFEAVLSAGNKKTIKPFVLNQQQNNKTVGLNTSKR